MFRDQLSVAYKEVGLPVATLSADLLVRCRSETTMRIQC